MHTYTTLAERRLPGWVAGWRRLAMGLGKKKKKKGEAAAAAAAAAAEEGGEDGEAEEDLLADQSWAQSKSDAEFTAGVDAMFGDLFGSNEQEVAERKRAEEEALRAQGIDPNAKVATMGDEQDDPEQAAREAAAAAEADAAEHAAEEERRRQRKARSHLFTSIGLQ